MVDSNAACCVLTVDKKVWDKDVLMQWVCGLASNKQVTVKIVKSNKGGGSAVIGMTIGTCAKEMSERNAILRSLCGMALMNALDQSPVYLLGGSSESSSCAIRNSTLTMASIGSWMSLASTVAAAAAADKKKSDDQLPALLSHLNTHLSDKNFLVANTPQPTLADYDLAFALLLTSPAAQYPPHVHRWLSSTLSMAHHFNPQQLTLPTFPIAEPTTAPLLLHFPSSDTALPATSTATSTPVTTPPAANKTKPTKQQQPTTDQRKELTEEEKKAVAEKRAKAKKEKKQKNAAATNKNKQPASATPANDDYTIAALDIRVGQITKVWDHPEAEKLYCEEIDVGEQTVRNIASGLRPFYSLDDMKDRRVLVLCNLKKRNLLGFPSHGMVLCASNDDHSQVQFVIPPPDAKIGERVTFTDIDMVDAQPETKVHKKKILQLMAPDLKTDDKGMVIWKTSQHTATTSAGPCHAIQHMPNAHVS